MFSYTLLCVSLLFSIITAFIYVYVDDDIKYSYLLIAGAFYVTVMIVVGLAFAVFYSTDMEMRETVQLCQKAYPEKTKAQCEYEVRLQRSAH